jgi:hypothetical protein
MYSRLQFNNLTGTIPPLPGTLSDLNLLRNRLTGTVPPEPQIISLNWCAFFLSQHTSSLTRDRLSESELQGSEGSETNCLSCPITPGKCLCINHTCTGNSTSSAPNILLTPPPPPPLPTTTAMSTTTTTTTMSTTMTTPIGTSPQESTNGTTFLDGTSSTSVSATSMTSTTLANISTTVTDSTIAIAMSSTSGAIDIAPGSSLDVALIAGVVGGIVALLLLIGVVAFIVSRMRRAKQRDTETNNRNYGATTMQVLPDSTTSCGSGTGDYGPIGLPNTITYNDVDDVRKRT